MAEHRKKAVLERVLETQRWIREHGPETVRAIELITFEELEEIRRIWVVEKHEIEDLLPQIYERVMEEKYPGKAIDDNLTFDAETLQLLKESCDGDALHFEMARNLLDIERRYRTMVNRRGLFSEIENAIERCFYDDEQDALDRARLKAGTNRRASFPQSQPAQKNGLPLFESLTDDYDHR